MSPVSGICGYFCVMINGIYVITDEELCPGRTHLQIAQDAIKGGAKIIQIRDKHASDRKFYKDALQLRKLTSQADILFFVNDRVHIAAAVGADGVNVGQTDIPLSAARKVLGKGAVVGVSAATLQEAVQAEKDGADYVGFGPVFTTTTKLDAGPISGLETLKTVCSQVDIPVVAIGGINLSNVKLIADNGAACASVISAVVCAEDMVKATSDLIEEFNSAVSR